MTGQSHFCPFLFRYSSTLSPQHPVLNPMFPYVTPETINIVLFKELSVDFEGLADRPGNIFCHTNEFAGKFRE
jgi:hypothetical protein